MHVKNRRLRMCAVCACMLPLGIEFVRCSKEPFVMDDRLFQTSCALNV
jgi:hypothetical protein